MRTRCAYCRSVCEAEEKGGLTTCSYCQDHVSKLDVETVNWLMDIIDTRVRNMIKDELDNHESSYDHEATHRGYY